MASSDKTVTILMKADFGNVEEKISSLRDQIEDLATEIESLQNSFNRLKSSVAAYNEE